MSERQLCVQEVLRLDVCALPPSLDELALDKTPLSTFWRNASGNWRSVGIEVMARPSVLPSLSEPASHTKQLLQLSKTKKVSCNAVQVVSGWPLGAVPQLTKLSFYSESFLIPPELCALTALEVRTSICCSSSETQRD